MTVSYFEMVQNFYMYYWDEEEVYERLDKRDDRRLSFRPGYQPNPYKINMRQAAYVVAGGARRRSDEAPRLGVTSAR